MDKIQVNKMIKNYKQGWDLDEHFTSFNKQLSRKRKKLKDDKIIIYDENKTQHLMIEV